MDPPSFFSSSPSSRPLAPVVVDCEPISSSSCSKQPEAETTSSTTTTKESSPGCYGCRWAYYDGNIMAQSYTIHGIGRGPIYMAGIFLSTALIYLASEQVGCVQVNEETGLEEIIEDCNQRVYGAFTPAALVTNIATISGVLIALLLPIIGAIIDYTPYRWTVGVVSAIALILCEFVQIFTNSQTWFIMAIIEAISGFIFEVQVVVTLAYLPDIARQMGEIAMNSNTAYFIMVETASQTIMMILVVAIALMFGFDDVTTARTSQILCVIVSTLGFGFAWKRFPHVPAKHDTNNTSKSIDSNSDDPVHEEQQQQQATTLPQETEKPNLLLIGFFQNWKTFQMINRDYKNSLRWFLLGVIFAEAAANAFITVAVIFLTEHLGLNTTEVGIFFVIALLSMILACRLGELITHHVCNNNPNVSWRLSMVGVFGISLVGALTLNRDNAKPYAYLWGFVVNLALGWYYQTQYLYMSMVTPQNQEAEIAGFFNYCRLILVWLPPLLFSLLVEAGVSLSIGVIVTISFFWIAIALLSMSPSSWEEVLQEVHHKDKEQSGADEEQQQEPLSSKTNAAADADISATEEVHYFNEEAPQQRHPAEAGDISTEDTA